MEIIASLKGSHKGRDVFILGNGPSINREDLSCLRGEVVIGMNASPLLDEKFSFSSSYYVVSDKRFLDHPEKSKIAASEYVEKATRVFRSECYESYHSPLREETFYVKSLGRSGFSKDLALGFYFGCTTTMLAIQLAYYIGARRIYLLGNDLNYRGNQARFYSEASTQENDHFTGIQIDNIRNGYVVLREYGVELFNCSQSSLLLPYLPYKEFSHIFSKEP